MDNPYRHRQDPTFATYRAREVVDQWLNDLQTDKDSPYVIPGTRDAMAYAFTEVGELVDSWLRYRRPDDARAHLKPELFSQELADVFIMICHALRGWHWREGDEIEVLHVPGPPVRRQEVALMYRKLSHLAKLVTTLFYSCIYNPHNTFLMDIPLTLCLVTCEHIAQIWCRLQGEPFTEDTLPDLICDRLAYRSELPAARQGVCCADRITRDAGLI
jgi:hypothetical protein